MRSGSAGPALRICFSCGFMGAKVMLHIVHFAFLNSGLRWFISPGDCVARTVQRVWVFYTIARTHLRLVPAGIYKDAVKHA